MHGTGDSNDVLGGVKNIAVLNSLFHCIGIEWLPYLLHVLTIVVFAKASKDFLARRGREADNKVFERNRSLLSC